MYNKAMTTAELNDTVRTMTESMKRVYDAGTVHKEMSDILDKALKEIKRRIDLG